MTERPRQDFRIFKKHARIKGTLVKLRMPKSLAKVQKKVAKKKGNINSLHENSRDAQKLKKAGARSEKLDRLATARVKANLPHCPGALPK